MNETEIEQLAQYVNETVIDEQTELDWIIKQYNEMRKLEQETACAFKLRKFLGQHAAMKQSEASLKELRSIIKYLSKEHIRISGVNIPL